MKYFLESRERLSWFGTVHASNAERSPELRAALPGSKKPPAQRCRGTKKPRPKPGLLGSRNAGRRSVLRNHRAAPVEAVDQRGADGLHPRLEGKRRAEGAA